MKVTLEGRDELVGIDERTAGRSTCVVDQHVDRSIAQGAFTRPRQPGVLKIEAMAT